jgi:hypothetical protein|uniref:Cytochrome b5 domain-containing protein 1 n=1 Tax=Eutreptiella gymnastica TaxID=73025 RepID=A0A7S4GM59_9EUGL|mmetsp:Transcript_35257/g.59192  ORF Transcript_35257/g.59192 Transcript_35257/m.59192 type:complete len:219 (+) Transcript_35257:74-730(+)|eukprot:CAMPEP_0174288596 /NCGR_PEP_ID=MMETSP0809-20121228/21499_1 /TAXON_ID=73025 ORGANISM="Eutreptiella gymnastica-like, Strain CCMP1594" /NCGR_SAMPLE_ID=MMETSP0809 /ASSEMBLY_ACC=CAM_ASM_000658 /LENGTH=218 /DNA_ID=CAMNT_0015385941 /DNA_START=74 /DNA_END=730 /DNA_ORIENTATION=+
MEAAWTRRRFYTPNEIKVHNTEEDCWVSALGKVLDLTSLIQQYRGALTEPIVRAAGTDISHWFNKETGDIKRCIDPKTGLEQYYTPHGRFVHVLPSIVTTVLDNQFDLPWWLDPQYVIGELTSRPRKIRIINTLNHHETTLEVCSEETMNEIQNRYLAYNAHAASYTWKRMTDPLDMNKTLEENGIADESEEFEELGLPDDYYISAIHIYFNDDLTIG